MKNNLTMKNGSIKMAGVCLAMLVFTSCEQGESIDPLFEPKHNSMHEMECHEINFNRESTGLIAMTHSDKGAGPIAIMGRKRDANGMFAAENHAAIFDSQSPTGDDTDLYTTDWGNVLIVNQDLSDVPNDNQYGAEMLIDFSAIGPVTMKSLHALDIDGYEGSSWVYLYNSEEQEVFKTELKPLGDNSKQEVYLGHTEGVMKMKVVLDGINHGELAGSGAIDNIRFCVPKESPKGCTKAQGYWKNHSDPESKRYDETWNDYLNAPFFTSGMTYLQVLHMNAGSGDEYIILAHQYIAASLNVAASASMPGYVNTVFDNATAYFNGSSTPSRSQIIEWSEILREFNNGESMGGPEQCD